MRKEAWIITFCWTVKAESDQTLKVWQNRDLIKKESEENSSKNASCVGMNDSVLLQDFKWSEIS